MAPTGETDRGSRLFAMEVIRWRWKVCPYSLISLIFDDAKAEEKHLIDSIENIREHKEALEAACDLY